MPRKTLAAAHRDSPAVVAMVTCIIQAMVLMMYCITPQWNSTDIAELRNTTTDITYNIKPADI